MDAKIEAQFREYADAFSRLDGRRQAELFADTFVSAGPRGVIAAGKDQFLAMSEQAAEESPISPDYSLVKAHWGAWFEKTGDEPVEFDVSYIVRKTGGDPKVVMFITHQDEEEAMKRLGLLPAEARA